MERKEMTNRFIMQKLWQTIALFVEQVIHIARRLFQLNY
ncbi:hypothetical protein OKW21_004061 [Catalinimonas alkaloidigena]|nr:hypothetical protein [Catalinimonas alkaloidigena]